MNQKTFARGIGCIAIVAASGWLNSARAENSTDEQAQAHARESKYEIQPAPAPKPAAWKGSAIAKQGNILALGGADESNEANVEVRSDPGSNHTKAPAATSPPKTKRASSERVKRFSTDASARIIALSEDGKRVAMANAGPTIIVQADGTSRLKDDWKPSADILDVGTGKTVLSLELTAVDEEVVLAATERVSHFEVEALAFSPDGAVVAVGTSIGQVKLFDARTGEFLRSFNDEWAKLADSEAPENWRSLRRAMGSVRSMAFSPDGSRLATCGDSFDHFSDRFDGLERLGGPVTGPGRLKVWDVATGTLKQELDGHSSVEAVAFSPTRNLLASAGRWQNDNEFGTGVILWDPETGTQIRSIDTSADGDARSIAFSQDGKLLAIGTLRFDHIQPENSGKGSIRVVDVSTGTVKWLTKVGHFPKPVFFPAEDSVVVLRDQKSIGFRQAETGTLLAVLKPQSVDLGARWNDLAVANRGHMLAIGGVDHEGKGSLQIWDFGP